MSLWPSLYYISKPNKRGILYPVWIRGYTQAISVDALARRTINAGYAMYHKHGFGVYKTLPSCKSAGHIQEDYEIHKDMSSLHKPLYTLSEKEYELVDFYKEIKYDPKSGKIDGRTLRQHIKHYCKKRS